MKMRFATDKYYDNKDKPIFLAGEVYDVSEENGWADRWLKRGGVEVTGSEKPEEPSKEENYQDSTNSTQSPGYDPGLQDETIVDEQAGEVFTEDQVEESTESTETPDESTEVSKEDALNALGSDESETKEPVVNPEVKVENKGRRNNRKG